MQEEIVKYPKNFSSDQVHITALTAFFNITKRWELNAEEEQILLGSPTRSTHFVTQRKSSK